jgi:hypothetical protein
MIAIFSDQANREKRRSCGSDTLTFERAALDDDGAGFFELTSAEQNGILSEISHPRVSRVPAERSAKLNYGEAVEIYRSKMLRRTLRISDIAPVALLMNCFAITGAARRQTWLSGK